MVIYLTFGFYIPLQTKPSQNTSLLNYPSPININIFSTRYKHHTKIQITT